MGCPPKKEDFFIPPQNARVFYFMKQKKSLLKTGLKLALSLVVLGIWYLVLLGLMLPYQVYRIFVPDQEGSQPISKFFRRALESRKTKRITGASLGILMVMIGAMSNIWAAQALPTETEVVVTVPEEKVTTQTRLNKPIEGPISQGFHAFHRAIDILAPIGTVIRPVAEGVVIEVQLGRRGWGNTVLIEHSNGLKSRYAHLRDIWVSPGNSVDKQTEIGTVGMTGWTTGPHLHLEIYENDRAIDPQSVLPEFNYRLAKN
jgi:hypothetical protein